MDERLAAAGRAASGGTAALVGRPGALASQTVRLCEGRRGRDALCEVEAAGLRLSTTTERRAIAWRDLRSIAVQAGEVRIVTPSAALRLAVTLDAVVEPGLAAPFAAVLLAGREGTLAAGVGALHELARARDAAIEVFAEHDDPAVPLAVGGLAVVGALVLGLALAPLLALLARTGSPPDGFVLLPRPAALDPRLVVAALAGSGAIAGAAARLALGPVAASWARGTLRGWHRDGGLAGRARSALAQVVLGAIQLAAVALAALLVAAPAAFARTVVDANGIHRATGLPLLSRDVPWSAVADVVPLAVGFTERAEGFETVLVLDDGERISTRDRDLAGGSVRAFYDFARLHAR